VRAFDHQALPQGFVNFKSTVHVTEGSKVGGRNGGSCLFLDVFQHLSWDGLAVVMTTEMWITSKGENLSVLVYSPVKKDLSLFAFSYPFACFRPKIVVYDLTSTSYVSHSYYNMFNHVKNAEMEKLCILCVLWINIYVFFVYGLFNPYPANAEYRVRS
jgi:hypothetical protein